MITKSWTDELDRACYIHVSIASLRAKGLHYSSSNTGHSTSPSKELGNHDHNVTQYSRPHRIATVVLVHFASSLGLAVAAAQVCATSAAAHSDFLTNIAASLERTKVQYPLSRATPPAYKKLHTIFSLGRNSGYQRGLLRYRGGSASSTPGQVNIAIDIASRCQEARHEGCYAELGRYMRRSTKQGGQAGPGTGR